MKRQIRIAGTALVGAAMLAACSTGGPGTTDSPGMGVSASLSSDVPIVDLGWTTLAGPLEDSSVKAFNGNAVIFETWIPYEVETVIPHLTIVHVSGRTPTISLRPGEIIQDVYIVGDEVMFEATLEGDEAEYALYLWRHGAEEPDVLVSYGPDSPGYSVGFAARDRIAIMHRTIDGVECVVQMDLNEADPLGSAETVWCGVQGEWPTDFFVAEDGTPSFVVLPDLESDCGSLVRIAHDTKEAIPIEGATCVMRGLASLSAATWTGGPIGGQYDHVTRYAASGDGTVELGISRTSRGSNEATLCGDHVYWLTPPHFILNTANGTVEVPGQIRRWAPGGEVEIVFPSGVDANDLDETVQYELKCSDGVVGVTVSDGDSATFMTSEDLGWVAPEPATEPAH